MKIEIYGTTTCKFCESAKTLCKTNGYGFEYIDLQPQSEREHFERRFGIVPRTVPQIVVDDKLIGSFDAFKTFLTAQ